MINLNEHQKQNLELILRDTQYNHVNVDGNVVFSLNGNSNIDESILQEYIDSFDLLTPAKLSAYSRINDQLQDYLDEVISDKYSRAEQDTFPYQRLESEAHQKDNTISTPTIDSIASSRGVSREEQLDKVALKTSLFSDISNSAVGKAQGLKDAIKASSDLSFINSVNFKD